MNENIKDQAIYWAACQQEGFSQTQENDFIVWLNQNYEHEIAFQKAQNIYNVFQNIPKEYTQNSSKIAHKNLKRRKLYNTVKPYIAYAAVFLLIFMVSFKTYGYYTPTFEAHYTASNDMKSIKLPDGTTITMDNKTQLDVTFYNDKRNIVLNNGQAFFDVAPNKEKVFSIDSGNAKIQVIGTSFEVQKNENETEVTVAEGIVKVSHMSSTNNYEKMLARLEKGNKLSINKKGKINIFTTVDTNSIAPWRESILIFNKNSLKEAFDSFSKYNDFELESTIDLSTILFNGTFKKNELNKFLSILKNVYSFQITQENQKIILSKQY